MKWPIRIDRTLKTLKNYDEANIFPQTPHFISKPFPDWSKFSPLLVCSDFHDLPPTETESLQYLKDIANGMFAEESINGINNEMDDEECNLIWDFMLFL
jgi:hypothetical protein